MYTLCATVSSMPPKTTMIHFRCSPALKQRVNDAAAAHDRFDSESNLIRQALHYYLDRLEAGALDRERDERKPRRYEESRQRAPVPPAVRSTEVAG